MSARALIATLSIFVAAALGAPPASAQPRPPLNGGDPFGTRPGNNHGGPFTPGVDGPAGPYTPGTTPGGNGNGPFTPGADGAPTGPYGPGTIDGPTTGGPFSGQDNGFWGSVKKIGRSIWSGIKSVGRFLWTLGGWAPWAHMPATGTLPNGGVGSNVDRNENTTFDPNRGRIDIGTGRPGGPGGHVLGPNGTLGSSATSGTANGATTTNAPERRRPASSFINP